ncbi:MAG: MFS transporter [Bacteroidetes bacterium]|nr:MFS transporter [Bacteroidota bacterium]
MEKPAKIDQHDAYAVLKIKEFRAFISARFILTIATQMQSVIVGWQIYQITKDALSLGMIGLAEAIPFLLIALFAGHVADHFDRRKIILIFVGLFLLCSIALFSLTYQFSDYLKEVSVFPLYVVIFFTGIARGFLYPSQMGLMAQIVPRELYGNSSTWNSTIWHIGAVTGPPLGVFLCGLFGISISYFVVLLLIGLSFLFYLAIKSKPIALKLKKEGLMESLSSGIKFVFKNQIILGAMSLDMFAVLFGGAVVLLPIFAVEILDVGIIGLGFMRAAPAFGAVVMALFLAYQPPFKNAGRNLLLSVAGFGLCIILFALSKNFYLSFLLLALSGMFDNVSVIIRSTIMQLLTPDNMRGRVAAVNSIFIGSSNEIGSFESGVAARLLGLIPSVIFGGSMTLLISGIAGKWAPKLRSLNLKKIQEDHK